MPNVNPPWVEGEKIPRERIREIFVRPPGLDDVFYRSGLIVGSRGSGKTTLFRHQKEIHQGTAIHISLVSTFQSVTKQSGKGAFAGELSDELELRIIGKAASLLAMDVATRLAIKGVQFRPDPLLACLPPAIRRATSNFDPNWFIQKNHELNAEPITSFDGTSSTGPLLELLSELGEASERDRGQLLLLLDRADMVPPSALVPVFESLDQSKQYVALVATRPGHSGPAIARVASTVVAGDHYVIKHLGAAPRSEEWAEFARSAISAQGYKDIPDETTSWIIGVSRDSLRISLELAARYLNGTAAGANERLRSAVEDQREQLMTAALGTLQRYHGDFRSFIGHLRSDIGKHEGRITGPVTLRIEKPARDSLFEEYSKGESFISSALRGGVFCMPEHQRWSPGVLPTEVELPPVLMWDKATVFSPRSDTAPIVREVKESDLFRTSHGPVQRRTIFLAFRMNAPASQSFRKALKRAIGQHPQLQEYDLTDGHTLPGAKWAETVRQRIKKAKLVVGDITGVRPDVIFELGFAYGLGKSVIPVVESSSARSGLPKWLSATQIGQYGTTEGINGIVTSVNAHLRAPDFDRPPRPPVAVPGLAVWLGPSNWSRHAIEQIEATAAKEVLNFEVLATDRRDSPDPNGDATLIKRAASAHLLIVGLDGTKRDDVAHYVCGAMMAKPDVGYERTLRKRIVLVPSPEVKESLVIVDSVARCEGVVTIAKANELKELVDNFCSEYNRWMTSDARTKKVRSNRSASKGRT